MRRIFPSLLITGLLIFSVYAAEGSRSSKYCCDNFVSCLEHVDMDLDGNSLIITCEEDENCYVRITEEYRIFVNDEEIEVSKRNKKLVKTYYENAVSLIKNAERLGYEGAKIGIHGASLGLKAVAGVAEAMFTEYELKDLEKDLEKQAKEIEKEAEKLEVKAELLEEIAVELEELHYELKEKIPDLNELDWF
jgi:hypothetical protein